MDAVQCRLVGFCQVNSDNPGAVMNQVSQTREVIMYVMSEAYAVRISLD